MIWVPRLGGSPALNPRTRKRTIQVAAPNFQASALWENHFNAWSCTQADPPLAWMIGTNPLQAKKNLLLLGAHWNWSPVKLSQTPKH